MKHSLILSLCAAFLVGLGINAAQADTDVSLNLRYNDPADPNEGGAWFLVAKNDGSGITGLAFNLDPATSAGTLASAAVGFTPAAGVDPNYGIPSVSGATIGHNILSGNLGVNDLTDPNEPGYYEFLYGQGDPNSYVAGVGAGTGSIGADPLNNSAWDGASVLASGVFTGSRPSFSGVLAGETNELDPNGDAILSTTTYTVRGDSLNTLGLEDPNGAGLLAGDADRDGTVGFLDFSALSASWQLTSAAPNEPEWGQGNFDDDDTVGFLDFSALSANWQASGTPPAIGAVPEPTSLLLLAGFSVLGLATRRRS